MPYISLTIPSHTALGQTVDTTISNTPARVTLIIEGTLRIEPDELCRIIAATTEGGQTTICAASRKHGKRRQ